ncbi:MAG: response regulator [Marinobacterium sp.]|nr:response regulator [Marinobacterium sp.]
MSTQDSHNTHNTRPNILIVDDKSENIRVLQQVLAKHYQLSCADSGLQALEIAADQCPDLILLDLMMPGLDGHAVCIRLKANPATRDIPVIFFTDSGDFRDEELGFQLGAVDYISRPVIPPIVLARIANHLSLHKSRRQLDIALQQTLMGSIHMLTDILALIHPQVFARSQRLKKKMADMTALLGIHNSWHYEAAAGLSQCGCIHLPAPLLDKLHHQQPLTVAERAQYRAHPRLAAEMLASMPHLAPCARMIGELQLLTDLPELPEMAMPEELLLQFLVSYDELRCRGYSPGDALQQLRVLYPQTLLDALEEVETVTRQTTRRVAISDLNTGMLLAKDVTTDARHNHQVLIPRKTRLSPILIRRLQHEWYSFTGGTLEIIDSPDSLFEQAEQQH